MTTQHSVTDRYPEAASAGAEKTLIRTDPTDLDTDRIIVDANGFGVPAYTARPVEGKDLPILIVLSEAFGLDPYIEDVTRRFAKRGYLAVAPDLMSRQGDPSAFDDLGKLVTDLLQHIPDEQALADVDAVLAWAKAHGGDSARVGISGFSWGARWTWLYAASQQLSAAVAWYGVLDDAPSGLYPDRALAPRHPIDVAGDLKTPVLGLYAAQDAVIPVSEVYDMQKRLAARPAGAPEVEFVIYPEAVHGFFADYRDDYHPTAGPDAWQRALAWLHEHGL
jgi:carboxymethylenebutenolidase